MASKSNNYSSIVSRLRRRAKKQFVRCDVTASQLRALYEKQEGLCKYTGVLMSIGGGLGPETLSVDRIIPEDGYVEDNIVLCCYWVNAAKMQMSVAAFESRVLKLAECIAGSTCRTLPPGYGSEQNKAQSAGDLIS